jgi:hypothetical protein
MRGRTDGHLRLPGWADAVRQRLQPHVLCGRVGVLAVEQHVYTCGGERDDGGLRLLDLRSRVVLEHRCPLWLRDLRRQIGNPLRRRLLRHPDD